MNAERNAPRAVVGAYLFAVACGFLFLLCLTPSIPSMKAAMLGGVPAENAITAHLPLGVFKLFLVVVSIGLIVATEGDWAKFCQAVERPDLVGHEGATSGPERAKNMSGWLGETINAWFRNQTKDGATTRLLAVGLPVGPVQDAREIFNDPHVAARRLMIDVTDPILGPVKLVGPVAKMSSQTEPLTAPAPLLGQHNSEVLTEVLGYTDEQVGRLKADGAI